MSYVVRIVGLVAVRQSMRDAVAPIQQYGDTRMSSSSYLSSLFNLENTTSVVIGGTGVLGGSIAETLASAGSHVVLCGRDQSAGEAIEQRIIDNGGSAETAVVDATSKQQLASLATKLSDDGRNCDVLVNAAGINSATPYFDIAEDEWDKILGVNLKAVHLACQVFGEKMVESGGGSIINIASMSAITPLSRVFTYSVSKAGVLNLTRNLAREWGESNVRVNALSPGFFPAEQNRKVLTSERVESILRHTPMKRFGSPDELAGAILLLASSTAGRFMTGENLVVDGGFSAMTI